MPTYYKAVDRNYKDFFSGTVDYSVGKTVTHRSPGFKNGKEASGYLSVTTDPRAAVGARWPLRLLEVEAEKVWAPHYNGHGNDDLDKKRATHQLTVVRELEAHEVFGVRGRLVQELIEQMEEVREKYENCSDPVYRQKLNQAWLEFEDEVYEKLELKFRRFEDDIMIKAAGQRSAFWAVPFINGLEIIPRLITLSEHLNTGDYTKRPDLQEEVQRDLALLLIEWRKFYQKWTAPPPWWKRIFRK
jgi:hypothetical protein